MERQPLGFTVPVEILTAGVSTEYQAQGLAK